MYEEGKCAVTPCARRLPPSHLDVLITSASALTRARQLTYLLTSRYSCAHGALVGTTHAGFGDRQTDRQFEADACTTFPPPGHLPPYPTPNLKTSAHPT